MSLTEGERPSIEPIEPMQPTQEVRPGYIEGSLHDLTPSRTALCVYVYTFSYASAIASQTGDVVKAVIDAGITGAFLYGVTHLVNSRIKY